MIPSWTTPALKTTTPGALRAGGPCFLGGLRSPGGLLLGGWRFLAVLGGHLAQVFRQLQAGHGRQVVQRRQGLEQARQEAGRGPGLAVLAARIPRP